VKHLRPINQKAERIEAYLAHEAAKTTAADRDVVGLRRPPHEDKGPQITQGCSLVF
jgi:hypothetical protein